MREALFLKNNHQKWRKAEAALNNPSTVSPDEMGDIYLSLNDDLAYAQTNYPSSKTTVYLNGLTVLIYQQIYKNKRERKNRFLEFWITELPLELYKGRRYFLISFIIFSLSALVGAISSFKDEAYVRSILGDGYVNMTIENIEKGDPLAVYNQAEENSMTYAITVNNIRVSFFVFAGGILLSLGSIYLLYSNGTLVGAFFSFFFMKGVGESVLGVMIHGTLELSAIVLAGGAGIMLGNSILYPGTYTRIQSLVMGAKTSVKYIIGLIPIFIFAGTFEGFVTRKYKTMSLELNLLIVIASALLILGYYLVYPYLIYRKSNKIASNFLVNESNLSAGGTSIE